MVAAKDLDTRHLMALVAVAEEGTFGRAAQRLGYTQSAVSQQIGALERTVGGALFDRPGGPRPVELTPLGKLIIDSAREVLDRVDAMVADIQRFHAGVLGRIDIGTFQSTSTALLPTIIGRLRAERPDVEPHLLESDEHDELANLVKEGRLDVSFLIGDDPQLEVVELFEDPFVVVARPEEVGDGAVPVSTLAVHPLIGQQDNQCQRFVDAGLRAGGLDPEYVFRTNDNTAVAAMVRAGMGMAVMPLLAVDPSDTRLAFRDLDPPIPPRRITLGWRPGRTLSPAAQRFIEIAQEVAAEVRERRLVLA